MYAVITYPNRKILSRREWYDPVYVCKHLSICGMENGLQEAEKQASKDAIASVPTQDDGGTSGGTRSECYLAGKLERERMGNGSEGGNGMGKL